MAKHKLDWPSDLTPARRATNRPSSAPAVSDAADRVGELIEAVDKLADQLRRVEAKVDLIHEQLQGLIAGGAMRPDISRVKSRIRAASSAGAESAARQPRKHPTAVPGAERPE